MKKFLCLVLTLISLSTVFAQMRSTTSGHKGEVVALLSDQSSKDGSFYCVGKDGFISHWKNGSGERYQVTDRQIKFAAIHPSKAEIAIYETDGNTVNTVSVWDCQKLTKKFSVNFEDSILSLTYSKKGSYIIAGTSTEAGTVFINSSSGNIDKPITDKMNMMSYVETANSEKSLMCYSLTGNICYYSFESKKLVKKIPSITGFNAECTFGKFKYIAGLKSGLVTIIDAMSGKIVFEQSAARACMFTVNEELYYFDQSSAKGGVINKIEVNEGTIKAVPYENITFKIKDSITNVKTIDNQLVFTSSSGSIYTADFAKDESKEIVLLTNSSYLTINDAAFVDETLYILTNKSILKTNEDETVTETLSNADYTNMIAHEGNLILWNVYKNNGVFKYDFTTNKIVKLFVPQGQLISVKSCAGQLIDIESGTTVKRFDTAKNQLQEIYYGSGVQDAVMLSQTELFIAKSPTSSIDSSFVSVNTKTHETLPLKIDADFVYAVTNDDIEIEENPDKKNVYAIGIKNENKGSKTILIKYNVEKKTTEQLYDFKALSMHAFAYAFDENIYTNVIDSKISSVNSKSKKYTAFARSSSLPKSVTVSKNSLVFVNQDGSISWLKPNGSSISYDWYISTDNSIVTVK